MSTPNKMLVVLDASSELEKVKPLFSNLKDEWLVQFSASEEDASRRITETFYNALFVQLAGGAYNGVEFLNRVWDNNPLTIRFLIAKNPTPELMMACCLGTHQVLESPLTEFSVEGALSRGIYMDRLLQNKPVRSLISRIRTFPPRPVTYINVMRELRSPNASAATVGELVEKDLAISTKLVQWINSAAFGFSQKISSPGDAVLLLGLENTTSLVLAVEAFSRMDNVKPRYFAVDELWRHSHAVAQRARNIALAVTGSENMAHEAFTAGLLHDIGKLALSLNLEQDYTSALAEAHKKNRPTSEFEREILGATHAEAGAYLLAFWGLPGPIIEAVARHHQRSHEFTGDFTPAVAVHLANAIEGAKNSTQCGFPEFRLDLNYPEHLGLQAHFAYA